MFLTEKFKIYHPHKNFIREILPREVRFTKFNTLLTQMLTEPFKKIKIKLCKKRKNVLTELAESQPWKLLSSNWFLV
jgi:hypothetical protein